MSEPPERLYYNPTMVAAGHTKLMVTSGAIFPKSVEYRLASKCEWAEDVFDYETGCEERFPLVPDDTSETLSTMKFCPYCGGEIQIEEGEG